MAEVWVRLESANPSGSYEHPMGANLNLTVALGLARELGPGRRVVKPLVDSGLNYLAGDLYA
jgi:cysteine synthase